MSRDSDLGWAAGIIDGEGCIVLYRSKTQTGTAYVLRMSVPNTSLLMLRRLQEIVGEGRITPRICRSTNHKPQWNWEIACKKAERVLTLLLPYLVNKRQEAEIGLLSRQLIRKHGINTGNPNTEQLEWLKHQLSDMKKERT